MAIDCFKIYNSLLQYFYTRQMKIHYICKKKLTYVPTAYYLLMFYNYDISYKIICTVPIT